MNIIAAVDSNLGIARNSAIPWYISNDLKYFKKRTYGHTVVMGRNTYKSIGHALEGRRNIVISSTLEPEDNIEVYKSPDEVLEVISNESEVFIIGGSEIYKYFMNKTKKIYLTVIEKDYNCDIFFPDIPQNDFWISDYSEINTTSDDINYRFITYTRNTGQLLNTEKEYKQLLQKIIDSSIKPSRNGPIHSFFSEKLDFDMMYSFPLFTCRRVPIKSIFEELKWILSGSTNTKVLHDKGVKVWDANSSREFLDKNGLYDLPEGEIGKTYGYHMRSYHGVYDQLTNLIWELKRNPYSRRHIITLWDPTTLKECALPPCLCWFQFYVSDGELSCMAMLRSSDVPIALHWNICYSGLFLLILSNITGYTPKKLSIVIGDAHIYEEHISEIKDIISRKTFTFPRIKLKRKVDSFDEVNFEDLDIINYWYDKKKINIKMIA